MKNFLTTERRYTQNSGHSSKRIKKIFKERKEVKRNCFQDTGEVIDFWTKLRSTENEGNDNPEWLHDIQETFCEIVKEIGIVITEKEQWDAIRRKEPPRGALPYWVILGMCGQNG